MIDLNWSYSIQVRMLQHPCTLTSPYKATEAVCLLWQRVQDGGIVIGIQMPQRHVLHSNPLSLWRIMLI